MDNETNDNISSNGCPEDFDENPAKDLEENAVQCSSYNDTQGTCCTCLMKVPHSQLFVCLKENCGFAVQQKFSVQSPALFFRIEKVFCGQCAFLGIHSAHKHYMQEAEGLAFDTASGEAGTRLQLEYEKYATLREDNPVQWIMLQKNNREQLKPVRFVEYLRNSKSIIDWHQRLEKLRKHVQTIINAVTSGNEMVDNKAQELMTVYTKMYQGIEHNLNYLNKQQYDVEQSRVREHHRKMGLPESTRFFRSAPSFSARTVSTAKKVPMKREETLQENMADVYQAMDDEVGGAPDKKEPSKQEEPQLTETISDMKAFISVHFDTICLRIGRGDDALKHTAKVLDGAVHDEKQKREVIEYMEENYDIKWPRNY